LSITTLSNLCENLEITLAEADSSLSKIGSLSSSIFLPDRVVCLFGCLWRGGKFGLEMVQSILSGADVSEEVKVVIEEVCAVLAIRNRVSKWELTELCDICQSFDIGLVQDL